MKTTTKHMKNLILLVMLITSLNALSAYSQELTQTVKGKITDAETQAPLPGAYVILEGSDPIIGAITDTNGNFTLKDILIGRKSFRVTYIGYEDVFYND